ncbi:MAG TPA: hypothetical protein VMY42_24345 [Thermoguttaceae bacterium]|nr:hypothetical protein [Thermoguttaceae bacterium]
MSPRNSTKTGGPYRKPRADVYTMLLIVALIALVIGIWRLYDLMNIYEFKFQDASLAPAGRHVAMAMVAGHDLPTKSTDAPTSAELLQFRSGG